MKNIDYKEIGFKGGLELHQQLKTRKLFCECPTKLIMDEPTQTTRRKLHAVASEMGEYDPAVLHEVHRDRTFNYQSFDEAVCLVELDEEPPHPVNAEALKIVQQMSMMLDGRIVDEIQVMRKTVIDGSNTAGFQRTMLVATDGIMRTKEGDVTLQYFCLEEDAARIMETNGRDVIFRLDRLGIPLLEIVTGPNFVSPDQAGEVGDKLGRMMRSLNVRRGIGSIRQDVNVSTKFGTRIEIKGVQRHRMIPTIMDYEARRQVSLFDVAVELNKKAKKLSEPDFNAGVKNINSILLKLDSVWTDFVVDKKEVLTGILMPGFSGILSRELCPGKWLSTEMKDQILTLGIKNITHAEEDFTVFGITQNEIDAVRKHLNAKSIDDVLIFSAKTEVLQKALDKLYTRYAACFDGVPKESRRALPDGNSQYMRPLPGEARMYPETDIPPVINSAEKIAEVRASLPVNMVDRLEELERNFGIHRLDLQKHETLLDSFEYGMKLKLKPELVFNIISSHAVSVRRTTGKLVTVEHVYTLLDAIADEKILPEAARDVLEGLVKGDKINVIIEELSQHIIDLQTEIKKVIETSKELADNPNRHRILMGMLMKQFRGRIDGNELSKLLEEKLK